MDREIFDWMLLLTRWLHITVAITWIGTSFFFMWLDRSFVFNAESKREGHIGDLWMVHGGGFYHVEKLMMGPTQVPETLHWFKWESYFTWLSGIMLIFLIFYTGSGTFLLDASVSSISYWQAVAISLASIVGSWLCYDFLWERQFTKRLPIIGHALTLLWFAAMSYLLCHLLSGRAAYIHIGAMLGTWMTANVFLRIIPRQVKMVEASKGGQPVNQEWAKNAKNRSTHNTYFTLPVIFIMLSNHFPSTYGNRYNWLILLVISAAGAAIREYFITRLQKPARARMFAALGAVFIVAVILFSRENVSGSALSAPTLVGSNQTNDPSIVKPGRSIKGHIKFEGKPPQAEKLLLPQGCIQGTHDVYSNAVLLKNGFVKNVLIRITKGLENKKFADIPKQPVQLDQRECIYEPRVIAVRVGQPVEFINSDIVFHNVRSVTKVNENFNVPMPGQADRLVKVFDKPEVFLQTKCSIHPWMSAYIAVIEHPYFDVSNDAGEFHVKNVPAGNYTVEAWHEVFGVQSKEITKADGADIDLEFLFQGNYEGQTK